MEELFLIILLSCFILLGTYVCVLYKLIEKLHITFRQFNEQMADIEELLDELISQKFE